MTHYLQCSKEDAKKSKMETEDETMFEMVSSTESNSQPKQQQQQKSEKDQRAAKQAVVTKEVVIKSPAEDSARKFISEIESPASETQMFTFHQLQQQQHEQSKSRKLSLKEKRKLRAERELTPRDLEQAAIPAGLDTPPQPIAEISQAFQKQFLAHPQVSGGSPSPPGRSGAESDHSNRSETSPNHPEAGDNGSGFTVQLPSRDRAASREFAVSRALGKYREKQKQQQNSQSNSDSQEELERTPNSTTPTPKSSPPRISMIEPEMEVPAKEEKQVIHVSQVVAIKEEPPKKSEADLEATLKNLDAKLAEFEGSIKPVSEFVPHVVAQSTLEEEDEAEIGESKDTEDDLEEDEEMMGGGPSSSDDGSPEMEMDTSANEEQYEEQPPEEDEEEEEKKDSDNLVLQDLVNMDTNQLQMKAEKAATDAAVKAEKAATEAAVKAEKAATEAAIKAEKAAVEAATKATKVATTAFSLFGASKFGKQLVAAAASAQAAATTASKLPKQKESISRVGSRRQSTEESIDTDDEWYRHEMRELEIMEYQKHIEDIQPSHSTTHQMNLVLKELCSVKPPIEKATCDSVENERMAAQNALPGPRQEREPSPPEEDRRVPELKRSMMRFQSSDGEEEDEEEEKVKRTKIRRRRHRSESSESEDEDATQSGPDSLIQDSSDDLLESDSKRKPPPSNVLISAKEKEKSESSPSEHQGEVSQTSSHPSSGKGSMSASQRAALAAAHQRPSSGGSGRFNGSAKGSPPKETSPTSGGVDKQEEEYWEGGTEATGGYYDENGEWVEANGYYDENGYWIETGGYYDDSGAWIEYAGYYDENGEWVEVENAQQQQQQQQIQDQAYFDDGGGGGGGGTNIDPSAGMPTVAEAEEEFEEPTEDNLNNSAGYFLAVAGVAVNLPPKQSTPANKKAGRHGGGGGDDDSCSSSYTDEAGDEDQDMDDLEDEEFVPEVASVATMSKQQSEDHSIAESKGSGTRLLQRYESEDNSAALLSEQHQVQQHEQQLLLQEDEEDQQEEEEVDQHVNGNRGEHKLVEEAAAREEREKADEDEEAKDSLEDIMARRKLAGNKGWSALSKTLKERKAEFLEAAVRFLRTADI